MNDVKGSLNTAIVILLIFGFQLTAFSQEPEHKIDLWYGNHQIFGNAGIQQPMINIIGQVKNPENLYCLTYSFNGMRVPIPVGPSAFRLVEPGEFNIEIDRKGLEPGEYNLDIIAIYKNGKTTSEKVKFRLENKTALMPINIDWSKVKQIQDVGQVVDGKWQITNDGLRTLCVGYDRIIAIGDSSWRDYELNVDFVIHKLSEDPLAYGWPSMGPAMHVGFRWQGHRDWGDIFPRRGYSGFGALFSYHFNKGKTEQYIWIQDQINNKAVITNIPVNVELGSKYSLRAQVYSRPGKASLYKMKIWKKGIAEPAVWDIEAEALPGELDHGSILLIAHQADITYNNVSVINLTFYSELD